MGKVEEEKRQQATTPSGQQDSRAQEQEQTVEELYDEGKEDVEKAQEQYSSGKSTSATVGRTASQSEGESKSHSESQKVLDESALEKDLAARRQFLDNGGYQSVYETLYPQLKEEIDPVKIEAQKKNADFRRNMHEVVSALQVMSDIGSSFAGGNAYRRNAPNYKQYEDEKAKLDNARDAAMKRLYEAQIVDMNFRNNFLKGSYDNAYKTVGDTKSENKTSSTGTNVSQTGGSQHVRKEPTVASGSGSGNGGGKDSDLYMTVNVNNGDGKRIGQQKIYFKSKGDMDSYYAALTRMIVQDRGAVDKNNKNLHTPTYQAYSTALNYGGDMLRSLLSSTNDNHTTQEKYDKFRTLMQGGKVKFVDRNGDEQELQLTTEQRRNILNSVALTNEEYRGLLNGTNYEIVASDDSSTSKLGQRTSNDNYSDGQTGLKPMPK